MVHAKYPKDLASELSALTERCVARLFELDATLGGSRNPARKGLVSLYASLEARLEMKGEPSYNPLDFPELTKSIESAFSRNPPVRLSEIKPFRGSGVYALYYTGDFPLYKPIADSNKKDPGSWAIYVGKAGKEGKRKGIDPPGKKWSKSAIYERLANSEPKSPPT